MVIVQNHWINSSDCNAAASFSDYCSTSKHSPKWPNTNSCRLNPNKFTDTLLVKNNSATNVSLLTAQHENGVLQNCHVPFVEYKLWRHLVMHCVCTLLHTDIGRHGGCCAEVGYRLQMKIKIWSQTFSPIAYHRVPATENRRHMPAEYIGLQLRQSKKLTVVCMVYHDTPW